ncbi:MAG: hypothetical protein S4CHLAM102_12550 [Chlamydiia bacterium]|nr:hypothetical protein [Chlamydiia bacterium]
MSKINTGLFAGLAPLEKADELLVDPSKVRILSLDGGGVRGAITLQYLIAIETITGKPIQELFDIFIGTSTGAIIAGMLSIKENGKPKYTARKALELYCELTKELFAHPKKFPFFRPIFSEKKKRAVLEKYAGKIKLSEIEKSLFIVTVDLNTNKPFLFSSVRAKTSPDLDFYLADAINASSDAIPYFPAGFIQSIGKNPVTNDYFRFKTTDGGYAAQNPEAIGMVIGQILHSGKPISMLSLGTGQPHYNETVDTNHWGERQWLEKGHLIDLFGDASSSATEQTVGLLAYLRPDVISDYLRLDVTFTGEKRYSFDYYVIPDLIKIGQESVAKDSDKIIKFVEKLVPEGEKIQDKNCIKNLREPEVCKTIHRPSMWQRILRWF